MNDNYWTISNLPSEIHVEIARYLTLGDVNNFLLTDVAINKSTPYIFSSFARELLISADTDAARLDEIKRLIQSPLNFRRIIFESFDEMGEYFFDGEEIIIKFEANKDFFPNFCTSYPNSFLKDIEGAENVAEGMTTLDDGECFDTISLKCPLFNSSEVKILKNSFIVEDNRLSPNFIKYFKEASKLFLSQFNKTCEVHSLDTIAEPYKFLLNELHTHTLCILDKQNNPTYQGVFTKNY